MYTRPHRLITDVRTRVFQYKFLQDILVNKYWLFKWNISNDNICILCKNDKDNLNHRFWECIYVKQFWIDFNNYYERRLEMKVVKEMVFFGYENMLLCTLIFAAKQYIHCCVCREEVPKFTQFLDKVCYMKSIEEQICKRNFTLEKWLEK